MRCHYGLINLVRLVLFQGPLAFNKREREGGVVIEQLRGMSRDGSSHGLEGTHNCLKVARDMLRVTHGGLNVIHSGSKVTHSRSSRVGQRSLIMG